MGEGATFISRLFLAMGVMALVIESVAVRLAPYVPVPPGLSLKFCAELVAYAAWGLSFVTRGSKAILKPEKPGPLAPLYFAGFICLMTLVFLGSSRRPFLGLDIDLVVGVCCAVVAVAMVGLVFFPAGLAGQKREAQS